MPPHGYTKVEQCVNLVESSETKLNYNHLLKSIKTNVGASLVPSQRSTGIYEGQAEQTAQTAAMGFLTMFLLIYSSIEVDDKSTISTSWDALQQTILYRPLCITFMRFFFPFVAEFLGPDNTTGKGVQLIFAQLLQCEKQDSNILYAIAPRQHGKSQFFIAFIATLMCSVKRGRETSTGGYEQIFRIVVSTKDAKGISDFLFAVKREVTAISKLYPTLIKKISFNDTEHRLIVTFPNGRQNHLNGAPVSSQNRGIKFNVIFRDEVCVKGNITENYAQSDDQAIGLAAQFESVIVPAINVGRCVLCTCSAVTGTNPLHQLLRGLNKCLSIAWSLSCDSCIQQQIPHTCNHMMWRICMADKSIVDIIKTVFLAESKEVAQVMTAVRETMCVPTPGPDVKLSLGKINNMFCCDDNPIIPDVVTQLTIAIDPGNTSSPLALILTMSGIKPGFEEYPQIAAVAGDLIPTTTHTEMSGYMLQLIENVLQSYEHILYDPIDIPLQISIIVEKQSSATTSNEYTVNIHDFLMKHLNELKTRMVKLSAFKTIHRKMRTITIYWPEVTKKQMDPSGLITGESRQSGVSTTKDSKQQRFDTLVNFVQEGLFKIAPATISSESPPIDGQRKKRRKLEGVVPFLTICKAPQKYIDECLRQCKLIFQGSLKKTSQNSLDIPDTLAMAASEVIRFNNQQ